MDGGPNTQTFNSIQNNINGPECGEEVDSNKGSQRRIWGQETELFFKGVMVE